MIKPLFSLKGVFSLDVCLYNIQGFRGEYTYTIDDFITIINSRHNGVGKTTLYDCIRFLCDSTQLDKEEREFFLNLNEQEGLFSITRDQVTYGFVLFQGKPPVFYRQVEGEDTERQAENFSTAAQDIGILIINGGLLNIFSKEVDLFSGSSSGKNYQLVKEITTHQQTEEMLDLMERSININQGELSNLRAEKRGVDVQVENMPYYFCVEQLEELLANDFYEDLETVLTQISDSLDKFKEVPQLNFNSKLERLVDLEQSLSIIQPTDFEVPSAKVLEFVEDFSGILGRLQPTTSVELPLAPLENLIVLSEGLEKLVPSTSVVELNTKPLEMLEALLGQVNSLAPEYNLEVSSYLPTALSNICIKLGEMTTACNNENRNNRMAEEHRKSLASTRVTCPIREEVYLIDGKCCY